jgi:hypothetical protein
MIQKPLRRKPRTSDRLTLAFTSIQEALENTNLKYQTSNKLMKLLEEKAQIEVLDLRVK